MESQHSTLFFVLIALIAVAWAYPTTVPSSPQVCAKMIPGHGPSPQKSESPYTLQVSTTAAKGGSTVQLGLDGHGHPFKGFYVQARDSTGSRIGTFAPDEGIVKVHGCGGIKNNAAHHSGKDDKKSVLIHWKAPQEYNGQVTFVATFVEEFDTFWTNVKSDPVTISNLSKLDITSNPAFTDSRKERATPKATQESRILTYNPYSPFSPLNNGEFDSKESIMNRNFEENVKLNMSSQFVPHESSRIRKRYYIPKSYRPSEGVVTNDDIIQDCRFHGHKFAVPSEINIPVVPVSNYATRYTYIRGQSPVPVLHSHDVKNYHNPTPGPTKGGFQYLDSKYEQGVPNHGIGISPSPIPTPSRKVKFYDDFSISSHRHFPPSYYPSSDISSYGFHRGPSPVYSKPQHYDHQNHLLSNKPTYSTRNGWSQSIPPTQGAIVNDYGVIDTAIVLPKDMRAFDIPRYGYLVYNPKRGPPFYIIPAETEAFEKAHFGLGRSKN